LQQGAPQNQKKQAREDDDGSAGVQIRVGSEISLISSALLRYVGKLCSLDQAVGTVTLLDVRCYGGNAAAAHFPRMLDTTALTDNSLISSHWESAKA